jgi:hypothetical protein
MGIWTDIGLIGGIAAAPFTGGASMIPLLMAAGGAAGGLGDALSSGGSTSGATTAAGNAATVAGIAEAARANALIQQATIQQRQDQLNQLRAQLALAAPGQEAKNAARGDILAGAQDATLSGLPSYLHVPTISGGLRPSLFSGNTRALGANMSRQAMLNNMSGADVPALTPLPQSTALDTGLQAVSLGGGLLNALSPVLGGGSPSGAGTSAGTGLGTTGYTLPPLDFGAGAGTSSGTGLGSTGYTLPPIDFSGGASSVGGTMPTISGAVDPNAAINWGIGQQPPVQPPMNFFASLPQQ